MRVQVNNAGIAWPNPVEELDLNNWNTTIAVRSLPPPPVLYCTGSDARGLRVSASEGPGTGEHDGARAADA